MSNLSLGLFRFFTGLAQGIALYILYYVADQKIWPATDGPLFAAMLTVAAIVPLILIAGAGQMRLRTLAIWTGAAVILCAGAGAYDIFRDPVVISTDSIRPRHMPSFQFCAAFAALMFILHALVSAGDADRRRIARYPTYFDVAWKLGVQTALAALFVSVFWLLLGQGAGLFKLIKIGIISDLLRERWFSIPATAMAFACALHITATRTSLVTGARTLTLTLLSWLLPVMTLFVMAFLLALPFTGLDPLWNTRRATSILLAAAAALIILVNTAYQDGQPDTPVATVLRTARLIAALTLSPLVVLAGYGLLLRVQQYGWTPSRILTLACVIVAACYAAGYGYAALRSRLALKQLEITNIATAGTIVAVILALLSPLADPARISVADQLRRLQAGKVAPEKFDLAFLRFHAGRYGAAALDRIAAEIPSLAERAKLAMAAQSKWQILHQTQPVTAENRRNHISVIHSGNKTLPDSFVEHDWVKSARAWSLPRCMIGKAVCDAIIVDLDGDGRDEILVSAGTSSALTAFQERDGTWHDLGRVHNSACPNVREELRTGGFRLIEPQFKDIEIAGQRLRLNPPCTHFR